MKLFLSFIKSFKNLHYLLILFFVWNLNFTTKLTFAKPERKKLRQTEFFENFLATKCYKKIVAQQLVGKDVAIEPKPWSSG